jgi:hypothetical protein
MQRKGYILGGIADWILEKGTKYSPLLKAGTAALSTYASFKDQQKKNQMQQDAYDDYMAQAEAAGHAARAAIDINYTPMTVSGVPTSKADVTDFTAVAARGGLMSIPNKQRKRYATGPEEFEVQEMDEEIFSPGDFKMETGVDVLGEQVFYDTGRGDRANAMQIWSQMQNPDKAIFDFDFEIFFMDGGWRDMIKSEVEVGTETQMASAVDPMDALNDMSMNIYNKPLHQLNEDEYQMLIDMANDQASARPAEGIMQAAHGGRIGYKGGSGYIDPYPPEVIKEIEYLMSLGYDWDDARKMQAEGTTLLDKKAQGGRIGLQDSYEGTVGYAQLREKMKHYAEIAGSDNIYALIETATEAGDTDFVNQLRKNFTLEGFEGVEDPGMEWKESKQWGALGAAKGGRIRKAPGGIMNLGGLEKDYRTTGGFVPIGAYEKKDDVPARLSKNEFVMTADAVRAAGGGSINRGAQRMYDTMKNLEAQTSQLKG